MKIGRGEVHLWRFALTPSRSGARAGVRNILSAYVGVHPARIEFQQTRSGGRPILAPGLCPGLSFNLAHSDRLALLAVAHGARFGGDMDVPNGYVGALAVEGTGHRIRYMDWS